MTAERPPFAFHIVFLPLFPTSHHKESLGWRSQDPCSTHSLFSPEHSAFYFASIGLPVYVWGMAKLSQKKGNKYWEVTLASYISSSSTLECRDSFVSCWRRMVERRHIAVPIMLFYFSLLCNSLPFFGSYSFAKYHPPTSGRQGQVKDIFRCLNFLICLSLTGY